MRHFLVLMAAFVCGCSDVTPPPPPPPGGVRAAEAPAGFPQNFTVMFTREYGMWRYRACTLEIGLFVDSNRASLDCEPTDGTRVNVARELAVGQVTRLRELVQAADLYGTDHIGQDGTPTDGIFETLRFRPVEGGRAAVLVTSGNKSFVNREARRDLLQLLSQIEGELSKEAGILTR